MAAAQGQGRDLAPQELALTHAFINFVVRVKGSAVRKEQLVHAYDLCSLIHPYLRTCLREDGLAFVPVPSSYTVPVTCDSGETDGSGWKDRLIEINNSARDIHRSNAFLHIVSPPPLSRGGSTITELFFSFNHCGSDMIGLTNIIHQILQFLGAILQGEKIDPSSLHSRQFIDGYKRIPQSRIDAAKLPELKKDYLEHLTPPNAFGPLESAKVYAQHVKLDAKTTAALLGRCKECGASPQSLLSVAGFVACAWNHKNNNLWTKTALGLVVHDLRTLVKPPLDPSDLVCGGPAAYWEQSLHPQDTIAQLASQARAEYTRAIKEHDGPIQFIAMLQRDPASLKMATFYATTLANNPVGSCSYGPLSVVECDGFHMCVGNSKTVYPIAAMSMHGYTCHGQFTASLSYAFPSYSHEFARQVAKVVESCLASFANGTNATMEQIISAEYKQLKVELRSPLFL